MTKRILSVVAVAAILVFASLSVTTSAAEMNCRIPFSFIVNGQTLPPGAYSVGTNNAVVIMKSLHAASIVLGTPKLSQGGAGSAKLVFLKTGDRYDLKEVWTGEGTGYELRLPRHLADRARAANLPVERIVIAAENQ